MKDEIKEILDDLLFTTTLPNVSIKLNKEKINQLKDYITNLQEENEHLRTQLNTLENTVIEVNKECNRLFNHLTKKDLDYKSRIDKAIKYINHEIFKRTILVGVGTKKYTRNILDNVLNILQGE